MGFNQQRKAEGVRGGTSPSPSKETDAGLDDLSVVPRASAVSFGEGEASTLTSGHPAQILSSAGMAVSGGARRQTRGGGVSRARDTRHTLRHRHPLALAWRCGVGVAGTPPSQPPV
jgi:hypothetical protein